jgi:hypothetical protein
MKKYDEKAAAVLADWTETEYRKTVGARPRCEVTEDNEFDPRGPHRWFLEALAEASLVIALRQMAEVWKDRPPYLSYRNYRKDGRGLVEIDPECGPKVRRIYELYAYHGLTLEALAQKLFEEGIFYLSATPRFHIATLHYILTSRAYIGEVPFRGQWHPGTHEPLVDRATWDRVQVLLGDKIYHSHELTYAGELMTCGHCGHPITGECKTKRTRNGLRDYTYYRCTQYSRDGHPRVRVTEEDLDAQVLALFARMRIEDENIRNWIVEQIRRSTRAEQEESRARVADLNRQISLVVQQEDRLVNMRMLDEIDGETFVSKKTELRDRAAALRLQLEATDRQHDEVADLAVKAFELSQTLTERWVTADFAAKRRILEIICLNFRLDDVTLYATMRKPFDIVAEGLLIRSSRGDWI